MFSLWTVQKRRFWCANSLSWADHVCKCSGPALRAEDTQRHSRIPKETAAAFDTLRFLRSLRHSQNSSDCPSDCGIWMVQPFSVETNHCVRRCLGKDCVDSLFYPLKGTASKMNYTDPTAEFAAKKAIKVTFAELIPLSLVRPSELIYTPWQHFSCHCHIQMCRHDCFRLTIQ